MLLGVGHAPIQVICINQVQHLIQDLLATGGHAVNVVTIALKVVTTRLILERIGIGFTALSF